jgi:hypothetical protein
MNNAKYSEYYQSTINYDNPYEIDETTGNPFPSMYSITNFADEDA